MINLEIIGLHHFEKTNLVIKKGGFDEYKCKFCGLTGKRYGFSGAILVSSSANKQKIKSCDGKRIENPKTLKGFVQITRCTAVGRVFENITPGSVHKIVPPPKNERENNKGLWVMGVGEPVKVLNGEYFIYLIRRK